MAIIKSEHELALAKELLDDIELSRTGTEAIILKASRLARLCGSDEFQQWLAFERGGYNSRNELSRKYMGRTGRWIDIEKNEGYWAPISQLELSIEATKLQLQSHSTPNVSGNPHPNLVLSQYYKTVEQISFRMSKYGGIKAKVISILHGFISDIYYEKELEHLAESIFEKYKEEVDSLITNHARDVLQQIPFVVNRLAENDEESVSQALTTVRRIIDSFADSIYPPSNGKYKIGDNELSLDASKHLNRMNVFVHERIESKSRKDKIRQNLSNLYARVSSGVHADVSVEEAKSLFLNCYLLLGEILHIGQIDKLQKSD